MKYSAVSSLSTALFLTAASLSSPPLVALAAPSARSPTSFSSRGERLRRQNDESATDNGDSNLIGNSNYGKDSPPPPSRRLASQTSNSIEINVSNENSNINENDNYNSIENVNTIKKERPPTPKPTKRRFRSPPPTTPIPTYTPTTSPTDRFFPIIVPVCSNLELNDCCAEASVNNGRVSDFCDGIGCSRKRCVKGGLLSP